MGPKTGFKNFSFMASGYKKALIPQSTTSRHRMTKPSPRKKNSIIWVRPSDTLEYLFQANDRLNNPKDIPKRPGCKRRSQFGSRFLGIIFLY